MKALIDTCVIMDAIQKRIPFDHDAEYIFLAASNMLFEGYVSAKSMTDVFYLAHRLTHDHALSRTILGRIVTIFGVLDTAADDIRAAIASNTPDYEDAVMIATAVREKMDYIVTRNQHDYKLSPVQVISPADFVKMIASSWSADDDRRS